MAALSPQDFERLRACCKDEESFQEALRILGMQQPSRSHLPDFPLEYYLNAFPNGAIGIFDHNLRFLYAHAEATHAHNESIIGKTLYDIYPVDYADVRAKYYQRTLQGESFEHEDEYDGHIYIAHYRPIYDHLGNVMAGMIVSQDITRQKHAERALAESEARYRQMFEGNSAVKYIADAETFDIIDVNPAAQAFYGYSREQMRTMKLTDINQTRTPDDIRSRVKALEEHKSLTLITRHVTHQGVRDVQVHTTLVESDGRRYLYSIVNDITDKLSTEQELRRAEYLMQQITSMTPDLVFVMRVEDLKMIYFNRHIGPYLGYDADHLHEFNRIPLREHIHPDDSREVLRLLLLMSGARDEDQRDLELRMRHRSGSWRWFHVVVTVFRRDENGRVIEILGSARDVNDRKQTEHELAENRRFLTRVTNTLPSIIYVYSFRLQDNIYMNRSLTTYLGYDVDDFPELPNIREMIIHPADLEMLHTMREKVRLSGDDEVIEYEYRVRRSDGSWCWMNCREVVFRRDENGQSLEILGIANDVTERVLIETALRQSENRYQTFLQNLPNTAVVMFDHDMRYTLCEGELLAETGYIKALMIGRTMPEVMPPEIKQLLMPHYQATLVGHEFQLASEIMDRIIDSHFIPVRDDRGNIVGGMIVVRDITQERTAQKQRLEMEMQQARVQVISNFVTNAFHQFGTPLSIINSSVDLARRYTDREKQFMYLSRVQEQVNLISQLVQSLTLISRLDGLPRLASDPLYVAELLLNAVNDLRNLADQKSQQISLMLPERWQIVKGDSYFLQIAFRELVLNAILHTPPHSHITIRLDQYDDRAEVVVSDNGPGIDPTMQNRVFERFFRLDTAQTTPGFGLGLPIVHSVIERHNGTIQMDSEPGKGTQFKVTLPA